MFFQNVFLSYIYFIFILIKLINKKNNIVLNYVNYDLHNILIKFDGVLTRKGVVLIRCFKIFKNFCNFIKYLTKKYLINNTCFLMIYIRSWLLADNQHDFFSFGERINKQEIKL